MKVNVGFLAASLSMLALGVGVMFGFGTSVFADPLNEMAFSFLGMFAGMFGVFSSFEKKKSKVVRYGDEKVAIKGSSIKNV